MKLLAISITYSYISINIFYKIKILNNDKLIESENKMSITLAIIYISM